MAPRKKSKAKKPTETMRQKQMRLRREAAAQKAAKNQKALPPGKKGGALAKTQQAKPDSPRRTKALQKQQAAAKGTQGGSRVGQPSGSANRMYGANVVNKAVKKAVRTANATKAAKVAGRAAVALGIAAEVKEMADRAKRDAERNKKLGRRPFEELRGGNRSTAKGGQGNRGRNAKPTASKPKASEKEVAALTQKGGLFYQGPGKPKAAAKAPAAKPAAKAPAAKPAAKKPAAKAPARSKTYSQADMMRDIRAGDRAAARSKELKKLQELREEAKRKSLEQAKKNRKRRNTTARGPRER